MKNFRQSTRSCSPRTRNGKLPGRNFDLLTKTLQTVTAELKTRVDELGCANSDLVNGSSRSDCPPQ